jgi:hypothetical protein
MERRQKKNKKCREKQEEATRRDMNRRESEEK